MSELSAVRRRLRALEECEEILAREWGETAGASYSVVLTDRMAVDARDHQDEDGAPDGVWVSASGLYGMIQELRADMEGMVEHVEDAAKEGFRL